MNSFQRDKSTRSISGLANLRSLHLTTSARPSSSKASSRIPVRTPSPVTPMRATTTAQTYVAPKKSPMATKTEESIQKHIARVSNPLSPRCSRRRRKLDSDLSPTHPRSIDSSDLSTLRKSLLYRISMADVLYHQARHLNIVVARS